jgi:signal transduction histidine kinase
MPLVERIGRRRAIDLGIALLAFAVTVAILFAQERDSGTQDPDGMAIVLAALSTLPLVARRRFPIGVLVLVALASSLMHGLGYPSGPPVGPALAVFFVASSGARVGASVRLTIGLIVALLAVHLTAAGIAAGRFPGPELLFGTVLFAAVWFGGDRTRLRRERVRELEERAQRAERDAERERQLAVAEERTRISRDLHDSAGHAINVILVHAGAARLLAEKDPARSRDALRTIESVARETLGEIDQLVHALREDESASVEPPVGLTGLSPLVQRHRDAGLDIELDVSGDYRLAQSVNGAAYRIVQESLTNALRHGAGPARVKAVYGTEALVLEVTNPTTADGASAEGHGLIGMHERAALVGGTLEARRANGAFTVRARLPYAASNSE